MAEWVVEAQQREELGKNANRRLRSQGLIPGVVYGHGSENQNVSVDPRELIRILESESGHNTIFQIQLDSQKTDVLIKDFQLDPLRGSMLHVDFQIVSMDQVMQFEVPIEPLGSPRGVREDGGIMDVVRREIEVECLPANVPDRIQIDVSELEIGDSVRVADLRVEDLNIQILSEEDLVLVTVVPPEMEEEEEVVEEEAAVEPEVIRKGRAEEETEEEETAQEE